MSNLAIPGRWLRHKIDGTIYPYITALANNPKVEEVPEEMAFPERFVPEKQKGRVSGLKLDTPDKEVDEVAPDKKKRPRKNAALSADASRKLPK